MNLKNWVNLARDHWREYLPKHYAALKAAGLLEKKVEEAAEQTHLEMSQLEESGLRSDEAWEIVRTKYLLLSPETTDETTEPMRPSLALMQEVQEALNHAHRALAEPTYEVPDPPQAA